MTTSRINAYRWPARLVSHKPFAAERYFITSSSIWQVFFAENYDFSFLFSLFCQWPHFLCKMHNPGAFCRWKTPPLPFAASVWAIKAGVIPILYKDTPSVCSLRSQPPSPRGRLNPLSPLPLVASSSPEGGAFAIYRSAQIKLPLRGQISPGRGKMSPQVTKGGIWHRAAMTERVFPSSPSQSKPIGFDSSPKGRALGMAVQFPAELQSVRFRQSLSLWERWHGASRDGEGEVAPRSAVASAGSRRCKCRLPLRPHP